MAAFTDNEIDKHALDWQLLQNGSISLYMKHTVLTQDTDWLRKAGYKIATVECDKWQSLDDLHDSFTQAFAFPAYYGRNFDALDDCLSDLEISEHGGLGIVMLRFDLFATGHRAAANVLARILSTQARRFALRGRRLIMLLQSDDPQLKLEELKTESVGWNPREWLDADRGL